MNLIAKLIGHRWAVCALLFFATTINYIDRQILSLLKPILDDQLHWTNAEFGLVNSAFQGAYGVSLLIFGWLIDKYGTKIGYAISIGAWSLAAMGHALVGSVTGFMAARVALGLGEGGNFPAAIKATASIAPTITSVGGDAGRATAAPASPCGTIGSAARNAERSASSSS
jgi:ACS family hexuronate transporter-like MFS transporter